MENELEVGGVLYVPRTLEDSNEVTVMKNQVERRMDDAMETSSLFLKFEGYSKKRK